MAQQAKILSFDDAKRSSTSTRSASVRSSSTRSARRRNGSSRRSFDEPARQPKQSDLASHAEGALIGASRARTSRTRASRVEASRFDASRVGTSHANASYAGTSRTRATRIDDTRAIDARAAKGSPSRASSSSAPRLARYEFDAARPLPSWLTAAQEQTARETRAFSDPAFHDERASSAMMMSYGDFLEEDPIDPEEEGLSSKRHKSSLLQKVSDYRRKQSKAKAEKAFTRQFGNASSAPSEAATPRAAVYRGEMGSAQRRAQRMQSDNASRSCRANRALAEAAHAEKRGFLGWLANVVGGISAAITAPFVGKKAPRASHIKEDPRRSSGLSLGNIASIIFGTPRRIVAFSLAACLVIACMFMYPAAKQYYTELRHYDQVQAEYEAVVARNAELAETRDYLKSDSGVEQMAHDKYGWVTEGENSVLVYGLPEEETLADTNLYIKRGSVPAPETWYSVLLDPLFGLE